MKKRIPAAFFLILVVWILADMLLHNNFLAPLYQQNASLWRPLNQMNVALVFVVRLVLLGYFRENVHLPGSSAKTRYRTSFRRPDRPGSRDCSRVRHIYPLTHFPWQWLGPGLSPGF